MMMATALWGALTFIEGAAPGMSGGSSSDWITRAFMGAAGLVGAFTAFRVAKRDSNAEALKDALGNLRDARDELRSTKNRMEDLKSDVLDMQDYQFKLRTILAQNGIDTPNPPALRSER